MIFTAYPRGKAAAALAGWLTLGCISFSMMTLAGAAPKPIVREEMEELTATVESIDAAERSLVLMGSKGNRVLAVAGPEVHNFDRIKVGDRVQVGLYAGVAVAVKPAGKGAKGVEEAYASARAPAGQSPAGAVSRSVATTVKIDSIDTSFDTVTFKRHDGIVRTLAVQDPQAKQFIHQLKPGDEVEIVYTEAIAARVDVKPH